MPRTKRGSTSETSPSPDRLTAGSFTMTVLNGILVAKQFKLTPIQTAATGIASVYGSGVAMPDPEGGFHVQDTDLVMKAGLTAAIAVALLLVMSILFNFLFSRIGWVRSEHYKLDFK